MCEKYGAGAPEEKIAAGAPLWVVDRVEGGTAALVETGGTMCEIPASLLPAGCGEGAAVRLQDGLWVRDPAAEDARRARLSDKLARLLQKNQP